MLDSQNSAHYQIISLFGNLNDNIINVYYYNDDIVDKFSEILKDAAGEIIYVDPECLDLEDIDWESWYEDIEDEL